VPTAEGYLKEKGGHTLKETPIAVFPELSNFAPKNIGRLF
jgi:hypothetical protein